MIIEINGKRYRDPDFRVSNESAMIRVEPKSFAEIVADMTLEEGDVINQYDDNESQIGQWHVIGMGSIKMPGEEGEDMVVVKYHVSQLGKDAQIAIEESIDENTDAALELAEYIAGVEQQYDEYKDELNEQFNNFKETVQTETEGLSQSLTAINHQLSTMQNLLDSLNSDFGQIRVSYESLNDRVTRLENK